LVVIYQSPRGFLGNIRIRTYFHGSNMALCGFGKKKIGRGKKELEEHFIIF
jgi:hypothetical protein